MTLLSLDIAHSNNEVFQTQFHTEEHSLFPDMIAERETMVAQPGPPSSLNRTSLDKGDQSELSSSPQLVVGLINLRTEAD